MTLRQRAENLRRRLRGTAIDAVWHVDKHDEVPPGHYEVAWQYLLRDSRLTRRQVSFRPYVTEVGTRTIEVDFSLPDEKDHCTWFVPVAFFPKNQVAPSLEVTDAAGKVLAIPTKRQNMALTALAMRKLIGALYPELDAEQLHGLLGDVISGDPLGARVSRLVLSEQLDGTPAQLEGVLRLVEDHFLLWVPVEGGPDSQHHISVCRHEIREEEPILRQRRRRVRAHLQTAVGQVEVEALSTSGPRLPSIPVALEKFLEKFALRPLEISAPEIEAARFSSCHIRLHAPDGFLVRHIRAGVADPAAGQDAVRELSPVGGELVIQGADRDIGHLHLARPRNPPDLYLRATLGLRDGTTTLWMLAAVLTAGLLWLVHHHVSYGDPKFQNKQIAAAILLVGPAFASAWSLRAEGGELLRSYLSGARFLLLISAALSVASALALAEILPSGQSRYDVIEFYAAAAYFAAVILIVAWLLSSRPVWALFRARFQTIHANLAGCLLLGGLTIALGICADGPQRPIGGALLLVGLALALLGANSIAEPLLGGRTVDRLLAGLSSVPVCVLAGYFLGFYSDALGRDTVRCTTFFLGCGIVALTIACVVGLAVGSWRRGRT